MCRLAFVSILFLRFFNNSFAMLIGDFDGLAIAVENTHIGKKRINGDFSINCKDRLTKTAIVCGGK